MPLILTHPVWSLGGGPLFLLVCRQWFPRPLHFPSLRLTCHLYPHIIYIPFFISLTPLNSASPSKPAATQLQWASILTLVLFLLLVSVTGSLLFPVVTTTILWALRNMVLFVDLEDETEPPELQGGNHWSMQENAGGLRVVSLGNQRSFGASIPTTVGGDIRDNPNKNVLTEALGCYP